MGSVSVLVTFTLLEQNSPHPKLKEESAVSFQFLEVQSMAGWPQGRVAGGQRGPQVSSGPWQAGWQAGGQGSKASLSLLFCLC